ncbi:protein suppressor of hairy wing-like [Ylistrum balloti]|uniref:protein suppressor of hairy wing-like n=1 Tax=Ylistrum balloti TaxID=509963 RepID=UPI002905E4A4|nr:protein suppressor of hairy wing-like [Ylistrum balloti]
MNGEATESNLDLQPRKEVNGLDSSMNGEASTPPVSTRSGVWTRSSVEKSMITATPTPANKDKYTVQVVTKFMCRFCARQFDTPVEMQNHIATHSRGKSSSHSCYVCGKTYSTPSKLQRHVRVHSGERPYACNICGRRFTRSDHVKQHLKVHMPQKQRNVCRLCDMKFLRRQTLHSHLQQIHGVSTVFTCHRCGEAFDLITQLHTHKESHLSLYPPTTEVTENGVIIKKEPSIPEDDENPVTGLAKFSLGPQPQVPEDVSGKRDSVPRNNVVSHVPAKVNKSNGLPADFQLSEDIAMESIIKDAISNAVQNEMEMAYGGSNTLKKEMETFEGRETNETNNGDGDNNYQSTTTITDDMNMFILPSDLKKIKQEPKDADEMEENAEAAAEAETSNDLSKECQTMDNDDDDDESDDDEKSKEDDGKTDEKNEENSASKTSEEESSNNETQNNGTTPNVQEIRVGPRSATGVKKMKFKVIGPASYKAAMQQKLRAKLKSYVPISTIPTVSSSPGITSAAGNSANMSKLVNAPQSGWGSTLTTLSAGPSTVNKIPAGTQVKKMMRCEHCCIWFEDYAMSLLHNSLHSADESDPFTCRKCLKKLGNRLEFTAHLVWHLEPTMDG